MSDFLSRVIDQQSGKFVVVLICTYTGLKGCAATLLSQVQLPYYVQANVDGKELQLLGGIAAIPWGAKGFIGAVSDAIPIGGFKKKWYMLISGIFGFCGAIALFALQNTISPRQAALLFLCCNLQMATFDLLSEGKYAELMRRRPAAQADVISFVWLCVNIGALMASSCVGVITDMIGPRWVFLLASGLMLQALIPVAHDFIPLDRVTRSHRSREYMANYRKLFVLAGAMGSVAIGYVVVGLTQSTDVLCAYTLAGAAMLAGLQFLCMSPLLGCCNLFMFLQECSYISVAGVVDRWYIAGPDCVEDGPAFSYSYFQSYTSLVGLVASWVALWLFQVFLSKWGMRRVFFVTTLLRILGSLFDVMIIMRLNKRFLHMSDKAFFLFGDSIILPIVTMLNFLPSILLISRLCPKDLESTTYAVLAGYHNFGGQVSKVLGLKLIEKFDIRTQVPDCQWEGLPLLVFLCHAVTPLLVLPLVMVLMPSVLPPLGSSGDSSAPPASPPRSLSFSKAPSSFESESLLNRQNDTFSRMNEKN